MKRASPEQSLHRAVAQYLDLALPPEYRWSTFPAGGGGRVRGAMLKAAGLKTGWPDILILHVDGYWWGLELKGPDGRLSSAQREFVEWAVGGRVAVVHSLDGVRDACDYWGVPLKASLGLKELLWGGGFR